MGSVGSPLLLFHSNSFMSGRKGGSESSELSCWREIKLLRASSRGFGRNTVSFKVGRD